MSFFVSRVRSKRYHKNKVMLHFFIMCKFTSYGVKTFAKHVHQNYKGITWNVYFQLVFMPVKFFFVLYWFYCAIFFMSLVSSVG